jgi:hypothetical protein
VVVNVPRRPLSLRVTLLLGSLLAPSLLCAGSGAAFAQPAARPAPDPTKLEAQETQAKRACDSGQVQEGVRLLTELLNQTNDGTYIFNLARCHQQNGQLDQALLLFRSYLRRTDVDPAAAARAREYIAVLERPGPAPPAVSPPTPAPADSVAPALEASATAGVGSPGRALRIGGLVAGGAGLASLAVGIYYARETHRLNEETDRAAKAGDKPPSWFDDQNGKGARAERRQWLFLGAGAAAVAAGGVLYYLGIRAQREQGRQATQLVLVPLPRGGGALLKARF